VTKAPPVAEKVYKPLSETIGPISTKKIAWPEEIDNYVQWPAEIDSWVQWPLEIDSFDTELDNQLEIIALQILREVHVELGKVVVSIEEMDFASEPDENLVGEIIWATYTEPELVPWPNEIDAYFIAKDLETVVVAETKVGTTETGSFSRQFMYFTFAQNPSNLSAEEEIEVQRLYTDNCTDYEIAELLGLLRTDVEAWRQRNNLQHNGDDVERQTLTYKVGRGYFDENRAFEMLAEKQSVKAIAAEMNVSLSRVYTWRNNLGIVIEKVGK
jgi:DNA-binding CsgD family transcriptional regulator